MDQKIDFEIYTDGSCVQRRGESTGYGSWAFIILKDGHIFHEASGYQKKTTSNRTEFQAVIEALRAVPAGAKVTVFTDSRIVVDTMTLWIDGWRELGWVKPSGRPIASVDQIKILDELSRSLQIAWKWIRAHAGIEHNERCDQMCIEARERAKERTIERTKAHNIERANSDANACTTKRAM